ncbi:MAG: hypothetical protein LUG98_01470 [Tannerellaceae bacterium]|nr:hypothetical protein [Tannerellaceae bacterium]
MKSLKKAVCVIACILLAHNSSAQGIIMPPQDTPNDYSTPLDLPVDFSLQIKNMHLWRGIQVTNSALTAVDLGYRTRDKSFGFGVWGGASFDGKFKEFDYYISYSKSGFTIALWDIYNFSPGATYNNHQVFNYKAHQTGHFVDLSIGYRFQGNVPLGLSWATIIHGRDRGSENAKNLYSTYVSADYPVMRHQWVNLDFGLAAAFALDKEGGTSANFYGHKAGIVNINVTASKRVKIGNFVLPVSAMVMWNPVENNANLQLALDIF